jgi:hypothetical protein
VSTSLGGNTTTVDLLSSWAKSTPGRVSGTTATASKARPQVLPLATPSYKGGYYGLMAPWFPTLAAGATDIDPNDLPS